MKPTPYERCPVYETARFTLRLVRACDAEALLRCYSDESAVALMNSDFCTSDFRFTSLDEMKECIDFWLAEYRDGAFVRFSVVDREAETPVGTVELFGGDFGVLRVDLRSDYENEETLSELFSCAVRNAYEDFSTGALYFKTSPVAEARLAVMKKYLFIPADDFHPGMDYYVRKQNAPIAYCGLACFLCGQSDVCPGCQAGGCERHGWCKNYNCCRERGLDGCFECGSFPCGEGMLAKPRIRAFARFAAEHGVDALVSALHLNRKKGMIYHYDGQHVGDYDAAGSEEEVLGLLLNGPQK